MDQTRQAINRLADRYLVRLAAHEACASSSVRLASAGLTPEVVAAFGEHFYLPQYQGRVAFGGLVRKLRKLVEAFRKAPRLWEQFKRLLGIKSLADIPKAIKDLAAKAGKYLRGLIRKLFDTWPLKLYTLEKGKLKSFNDMLDGLLSKSPRLKAALSKAVGKFGDFGEMVRQKAPRVMGALMVGIYIWVWLNVVEFEWDFKGLMDAVTGALTFPEFLATLPGSAFGALLNIFGFGTFTLLPLTIAARVLYLIQYRYVSWTGRGFTVDWKLMQQDFGVGPEAAAAR
jgi:hypothetical protein